MNRARLCDPVGTRLRRHRHPCSRKQQVNVILTPGSLAIISASFASEDRSRAIGAWSGLRRDRRRGRAVHRRLAGRGVVVAAGVPRQPAARGAGGLGRRSGTCRSVDPTASAGCDLPGTTLGALGLAGLTYASIAGGERGVDPLVVAAGVLGVLALAGFVLGRADQRPPAGPTGLFRSRQFTVANIVTFLVYGALGAVLFLLVLSCRWSPASARSAAGTSLLPFTLIMLALSARSGALADRIGPRLQMTAGPLIAACGLLLMLRIGPGASYATEVLPAVVSSGWG